MENLEIDDFFEKMDEFKVPDMIGHTVPSHLVKSITSSDQIKPFYSKHVVKNYDVNKVSDMDSRYITYCFMQFLTRVQRFDIVLHEFAYRGTFIDILGIVNDRCIEYEIKCTESDFKNDFKKTYAWGQKRINKHGVISKGKSMVNNFYFVIPRGIIKYNIVPVHCGIIEYFMEENGLPTFTIVKVAPLLKKDFISPGTWKTIAIRSSVRNQNLVGKYVNSLFKSTLSNAYKNNNIKHNSTN